jgi:hypothetical protein
MSKEIVNTGSASVVDLDGFAGYTRATEGDDDSAASSRVIQGEKIKFLDPNWLDSSGNIITGKLLTVLGVLRVANKWDLFRNVPLITHILAPNQKFPNFDKLNDACDDSEWGVKFGKEVGPWSGQHVVYFIDALFNRYCWPSPTSTIGSSICVEHLVDQINIVRKVKGMNVYPVSELSHTDYPTGYGLKQRPYLLKIKNWVRLGPDQAGDPLPASDKGEIGPPTSSSPTSSSPSVSSGGAPPGAQTVTPPTAKEITDDEIPW